MKELVSLVGQAKARMDTGFSQIGRGLEAADPAQRALMVLASRCVALGNAIIVLAMNHHPNESLPLLRSLYELALRMRWISEDDQRRRAEEFFQELSSVDWSTFWKTERLARWMEDFGVSQAAQRRLERLCGEHVRANAQGLPWGHVFGDGASEGVAAEELLRLSAMAMGQALKALERRWPGQFKGAEEIWEKAMSSQEQTR